MANMTADEEDPWEQFRRSIHQFYSSDAKWVTSASLACLTVSYAVVITAGVVGNLLVLTAILRKRDMRVARNIFIGNLAVSDLCLCAVTMPLTFMEVVYQRWQWGDSALLCHLQAPLQAVFVIISSLSISAIATDRYIAICCSGYQSLSARTCLVVVPVLWLVGLSICSPLAVYRQLLSTAESLALTSFQFSSMVELYSSHPGADHGRAETMQHMVHSTTRSNTTGLYVLRSGDNNPTQVQSAVSGQVEEILEAMHFSDGQIVSYAECIEVWPSHTAEQVYTWMVTLTQFLLPLAVAAFANSAIYAVLKERLAAYTARHSGRNRMLEIQKMKRTSKLLICLVALFLICWFPLSLFQVAQIQIRDSSSDNTFFSLFAACHLFGMTSACLNPVLYGFLNESYKKEFKAMWVQVTGRIPGKTRVQMNLEMELMETVQRTPSDMD